MAGKVNLSLLSRHMTGPMSHDLTVEGDKESASQDTALTSSLP